MITSRALIVLSFVLTISPSTFQVHVFGQVLGCLLVFQNHIFRHGYFPQIGRFPGVDEFLAPFAFDKTGQNHACRLLHN